MIHTNDFNLALNVLHRIVNSGASPVEGQFSAEYREQGLLTTAVKIIHQAGQEGTSAQRKELLQFRHEVAALNSLLSNRTGMRSSLGAEIEAEIRKLEKVQILLPQTSFERMVELALRIPCIVLSILGEIIFLPIAGLLVLCMLAKPDFNPKQPKSDAIPILLLHGSGFNESQWVLGRNFLKKQSYGSVFSLNYDGLLSNEAAKGIDDYALGKVRDKVLEIKQLTGQDRLILIGHSMGGMIAGYYAENCAEQDRVKIEHVMTIASPWKGCPLLNRLTVGKAGPKRYEQMKAENLFRQQLVAKAVSSERAGKREYYSIGSKTDPLAPATVSLLSEDPRRQQLISYIGHNGLMASVRVWYKIRSWLDAIYLKEAVSLKSVVPLRGTY